METSVVRRRYGDAFWLVIGQGASGVGSSITSFGLNVWIFEQSGSYATFAVLAILAQLPVLFLAPFAGAIVDSFPKRYVLLACEALSVLAILLAAVGTYYELLNIYGVACIIVLLSIGMTVRWPAISACVAVMADDEKQLASCNGLIQVFEGLSMVAGPPMGALFLGLVGLVGIYVLDIVTFLLSASIVFLLIGAKFLAKQSQQQVEEEGEGLRYQLVVGWRWIAQRKPFVRLLSLFVMLNFSASVFVVSIVPYLLGFLSKDLVGIVMGIYGLGFVLGGWWFAVSGGPKRRIDGVVYGILFFGFVQFIWGFQRGFIEISFAALLLGLVLSLINASSQTIWQLNVPQHLQGRVFAIRKMIAWSLNPVTLLFSIPFSQVFLGKLIKGCEALEAGACILAPWGTGETGEIGLMNSILGLFVLGVTLYVIFSKSMSAFSNDINVQ